MAKTSTGLEENVASLLCYVLAWVTGIIFVIVEQKNKVVRFHAIQSIIVFLSLSTIGSIMSALFGGIFGGMIGLFAFFLWVVLMVKAYQGGIYKLPIAGDFAEKWAGK
jgi:uncharacterized membrane protein